MDDLDAADREISAALMTMWVRVRCNDLVLPRTAHALRCIVADWLDQLANELEAEAN